MGQKSLLILLVIYAVYADAAGSGADTTLVLEAPEAVPVGRNATYQCCTSVEESEVQWAVQTPDGSSYTEMSQSLIEELETMWNIYLVPHPSDRHALDNIRLVAMATEDNNKTIITCNEFDPFDYDFFPIPTASETEKLITIGPPLAPAPFVEARNATAVQVSWKEPFIWEGYTIDGYFITVENTSSGEVWNKTVNATSIIIYDEGIAVTCAVFNVSAESILGSSKPGVVTSGFPIGPFNDTAVNAEVVFKQNDRIPKVVVELELPSACNFEMANYTIFIWENGLENETLTYGPNEHSYSNGRSVTRVIPFNSSEPYLAVDTEYLMTIEVTTSAGRSASETISFCTVVPSHEDPTLCPAPADLVNGVVTFTGNSVGDTATYTCNSGFELVGNATVTCTQVDENSAAYPPVLSLCRPLCPEPADIVNGMITSTGNSVGDTATYTCNSGFELVGNANVTCMQVDENSAAYPPVLSLCRPMLVLEAPEAVPVGRNVTYRCISFGRNEANWAVGTPDGEHYGEADINIIEELETWNIHLVPHPSVRPLDQLHNITLVALATEENNNTNITCNEADTDELVFVQTISKSKKLITIGPPLAPAPFVEARNATAMQVSWKEPFIWEGYTIDSYFITVENTSSGAVIRRETVNATSTTIYDEGIAVTCAVFNVSARSNLGSSKPGVVTSGFPIGVFNDAAVSIVVRFKQNDLTPKVDMEFELPSACNFEMANYTIFIRENGLENETLTYGPSEHSYSNGRSVTRAIPFNSSEPDLAVDTEYLMIIEVNTSAGISTSGTINFCTVTRGCEGSTAPLSVGVIVGIAVGSSIIAIFMLCLLIVVASFGVQRKRKRRVVVSVRGMVDNPIYVGDEEQYENIEGYQPTFISGPPQIQFMAPAPYAVTGPPPTLPEPRKGKEFENLAENSTPSADRLSKVSVGDDQNVYVKSEC